MTPGNPGLVWPVPALIAAAPPGATIAVRTDEQLRLARAEAERIGRTDLAFVVRPYDGSGIA